MHMFWTFFTISNSLFFEDYNKNDFALWIYCDTLRIYNTIVKCTDLFGYFHHMFPKNMVDASNELVAMVTQWNN